jgi:alkaline phosphatase
MNKLLKITITLAALLNVANVVSAQKKQIYTVADAHAHNDYANKNPFYGAYDKGFGSIEADVFAVDGKLMVAHAEKDIKPQRTLKNMYIDPLVKKLKVDTARQLRLLIDLKVDYHLLMPLIIKELEPLMDYAAVNGLPGRLHVVITGGVPPAVELANYPNWLTFDVDHLTGFTTQQLQRISLLSYNFTKYSKWKGTGKISTVETAKLLGVIDSVHNAGKMIRFWETPDNKTAWQALIGLGVDVIGTDKVEKLGNFLNDRNKKKLN